MHVSLDDWWPEAGLSPIERAMLEYLARTPRPVSVDELLTEVWGYASTARSRTVTSTVQRVRAKIEPDPATPVHLLTLRGQGYQLVPPGAARAGVPAQSVVRTNVGAPSTALLGRDDVLAQLSRDLTTHRLITLIGIGGLGKTRLATELIRQQAGQLQGGAWLCDLSLATTADDMLGCLADVLGAVRSATALTEQVTQLLAHKGDVLMVLDNFEQLDADASSLVEHLLAHAPDARFLVTSRRRLGLPGEQVCSLEPLPASSGAELLRQRIVAVAPHRPLDPGELIALSELLEGIPLALEMVAARARLASLTELHARLKHSFAATGTLAHAPERQRTLRATFDWSWNLLTEPQRTALAEVSVFRGGFTLDAASQVLSEDAEARLPELLDRAMVQQTWSAHGQRFRLFESIRTFVGEAHPQAVARAASRHADWAHRVALDLGGPIAHPNQLDGLATERHNLMAASRWCLEHADRRAIDILDGMYLLYRYRRLPDGYLARLHEIRAVLRPSGDDAARLCAIASYILETSGQADAAAVECERGLILAPEDSPQHAWLSLRAGSVAATRGKLDEALMHAERAVAAASPAHMALALGTLAAVHIYNEDADATTHALRRVLEHTNDQPLLAAWALRNLAMVHAMQGDIVQARGFIARARERFEGFDAEVVRFDLDTLAARLYAMAGDVQAGAELALGVVRERHRLAGRLTLIGEATVLLLAGYVRDARPVLEDALRSREDPTSRAMVMVARALDGDIAGAERCEHILDADPGGWTVALDRCRAIVDVVRGSREADAMRPLLNEAPASDLVARLLGALLDGTWQRR